MNLFLKNLDKTGLTIAVLALIIGCSNTDQTQQAEIELKKKDPTVESKANVSSTAQPMATQQSTEDATATTQVENKKEETKPTAPEVENKKIIPTKVKRVVDGDTMEVSINGKTETVRLLLVDTPETKHPDKPVQPFGPEASAFAKETLLGKNVKIEIDVSERDKYGRLLVYLWIGDKMFNQMLLEKGLARVAYVYPPNVKYVDQYREVQKRAQQAGIGIWSIENYAQDNGFHAELASENFGVQKPAQQQPIKHQEAKQNPKPSTSNNSHPEWAKAEAVIQSGGDCDCSDFSNQAAAQSFFEAHNPQSDPYGLDGPIGPKSTGKPGVACESLP